MKWIVIGALLAAAAIWWMSQRAESGGGARRPKSPQALRKQLAGLTHDRAVADRLIAAEQKRHPELGEAAVIRRVIKRLRSERRR